MILITRPEADARPVADLLESLGYDCLIEPLLSIRYFDPDLPDMDGIQAVLFTSANGVRAFTRLSDRRDIRVLAVGSGTARCARESGFTAVDAAGGDVDRLAALARERLDPSAGPLFHAAGSVVAGDLKGHLEAEGFEVLRLPLYEAVTSNAFSEPCARAIRDGNIDAALIFSPRTGRTFATLVRKASLENALDGTVCIALSRNVEEAVGGLQWKGIHTAETPSQEQLIKALRKAVPPT